MEIEEDSRQMQETTKPPPFPSIYVQEIEGFVLAVVGRTEEVSPMPHRFLSNMLVECSEANTDNQLLIYLFNLSLALLPHSSLFFFLNNFLFFFCILLTTWRLPLLSLRIKYEKKKKKKKKKKRTCGQSLEF
jgi:hypothetical protein